MELVEDGEAGEGGRDRGVFDETDVACSTAISDPFRTESLSGARDVCEGSRARTGEHGVPGSVALRRGCLREGPVVDHGVVRMAGWNYEDWLSAVGRTSWSGDVPSGPEYRGW